MSRVRSVKRSNSPDRVQRQGRNRLVTLAVKQQSEAEAAAELASLREDAEREEDAALFEVEGVAFGGTLHSVRIFPRGSGGASGSGSAFSSPAATEGTGAGAGGVRLCSCDEFFLERVLELTPALLAEVFEAHPSGAELLALTDPAEQRARLWPLVVSPAGSPSSSFRAHGLRPAKQKCRASSICRVETCASSVVAMHPFLRRHEPCNGA